MITFKTQDEINVWVELVKTALPVCINNNSNVLQAASSAAIAADEILVKIYNRTPDSWSNPTQ